MRQEYRYEQKMLELFREGVKITVADLSLKGGGGVTPMSATNYFFFK